MAQVFKLEEEGKIKRVYFEYPGYYANEITND